MQTPLSENDLTYREQWERCAPNAFRLPDEEVLAMIAEIRLWRATLPNGAKSGAASGRISGTDPNFTQLDHLPEGSH
jgi:hypothetical protein